MGAGWASEASAVLSRCLEAWLEAEESHVLAEWRKRDALIGREVTWADGRLILGAGDTLTVPVGLAHGFRNPASADAIAFVIRGAAAPAAPQFEENRMAAE